MMRSRWWVLTLTLASAGALLALEACTDADVASDPGVDASADGAVGSDGDPGDSATPSDGGGGDAGKTVSFTVPAGGGSVDVQGATMKLSFAFPASAAGKTITLTPGAPADIGWPAGQFAEVIKMGPDGERFADPIVVKPEKRDAVSALLSFGDGASKGPASPVPLAADGSGFEVRHFSTLVVLSPGRLCDSEGYTDTPNDPYCANGVTGHTTQRVITCKGYSYCLNVALKCCVEPGKDAGGCTWADAPLLGSQTPTDSNGGQYPYCEGDAGEWDGGASGCLNPNPSYFFRNTNDCVVSRFECGPDYYQMTCTDGGCACVKQGPSPVPGPSFPQGATCDNTVAMKTAFVQKCNYPAHQ